MAPDAGAGADDAAAVVADAAASSCPRAPAAADRVRYVVVSHPYDADGMPEAGYEVLALSADGAELAPTGHAFELGRATSGVMAFTPDGEVGIVAQEDGTLGVVRLGAGGEPSVVHAAFEGSFYAAEVVMTAAGDAAYVLDTQWRDNGGGVYRVAIGCDGALVDKGRVAEAKLPAAWLPVAGADGAVVVVADDVLDSAMDRDAHLMMWGAQPAVVGSVDVFPDDEAIVGAAAITADGGYVLVGDNSAFSGVPNRVGVAAVGAEGLTAVQVLSPIEDPYAIVASPFDDAAIVVSGFGDAVFALDYDPGAPAAPFAVRGELAYEGAAPQLPGRAVMIERGALTGLVVIAENTGVRRVAFRDGGQIEDLGVTAIAGGLDAIVGAIGLQP